MFMSVDPGPVSLMFPQSLNRYIYAMADPVNYTDPSGLSRETPVPPPTLPIYWPSLLEGTIESYIELPTIPSFSLFVWQEECSPGWITGPMFDPSSRRFEADDLNIAALAVYAEASGSGPPEERDAIASVIYNRLDSLGYTGGRQVTLTGVVTAGEGRSAQFRAVTVPGENSRFERASSDYRSLDPAECAALRASIDAIRRLIQLGSQYDYTYFRGGTTGPGRRIGGSRFGHATTFPN